MTNVIFTVGNDMRADDGAGPFLAALLEADPAAGWEVIDGGASPENHTHRIRALSPKRVVIVDAADMGLAPGEVRRIDEDCVARHFLITTHAIPLNFLIDSLRETVPEIVFLGIQPREIVFMAPMTDDVRRGVAALHRTLVDGVGIDSFPGIAE
ncbi:hydrogenase maturation peptidase HycI [Telmatospirillum siberiense]|uniref:Hydrogenase maturation peptidase HycI n=1 Tax=Telmatospirillum siberiense TaxID=382514 RepID=A0A2N3PPN6_9PROT|nr:hydrogenase maturation peptidase HycI [Telmatospirillum siberiense]PKU22360.1 hydrogenase maturation peptidase HycI [Telmatospirillum siberiense]